MIPAPEPVAAAGGTDADLTGKTLGDFHVLRRLGQGGMGHVYLAEQLSLKRQVALKILKAEQAGSATSLQRFKAEAEAVARATHANIVQVYAIGEAGGLHYMALEYIDGRNLREYLEKKGPPEVLVALNIMRQVASALLRAGELGIIHRDIKPENILLTRKGEVKVSDFGLSRTSSQPMRLTTTGVTMGTPLYMSPEQVEGRPLDSRTDMYSFGVTCYHLLAGHPPFSGLNPMEVALQHVHDEPHPLAQIRPDLPPALCAIVHKMMAKPRENRYQTGRELIKDLALLRETLAGVTSQHAAQIVLPRSGPVPTAAPSVSPPQPGKTGPGKDWLRWAAVCSIGLAFLGGAFGAWLRNSSQASPSRDQGHGASAELKPQDEAAPTDPLLSSHQERERWLAAELYQYGKPGEDRERLTAGLKYAVELGLLYLDERRLDDAQRFFQGLNGQDKPIAYQKLGQMGQAIVLAFRDRPRESNALFRNVVRSFVQTPEPKNVPQNIWYFYLLRSHRQFRRTVARALDQNADNDGPGFPQELQYLRRPPGMLPRGRGKGF
jgi:serine/threonine protein kinase